MRCCVVSEASVPEESVSLLRDACSRRGIAFDAICAKGFDFDPTQRLQPGDLLYNAATSVASRRVEQFVYAPGVATFYSSPNRIYFAPHTHTLVTASAGIPMPKTVYVSSSDSRLLRKQAERVGGFPLVIKVLGRSAGVGTMLVESTASLQSVVEFAIAQGHSPLLCQFIPDAVHWRVIVLGPSAVAGYRNKRRPGDFRSYASTEKEDLDAQPPGLVVKAAVRGTAACELEFAGVDVLEDRVGGVWFLEANFPCYYPHAQVHGGTDIAGSMVDYLVAKAVRFREKGFADNSDA
jgi:hypothetical protein